MSRPLQRFLAIVVAGFMIGGAFYGRAQLDDDDGGNGNGGGGGLIIACVRELAHACEEAADEAGDVIVEIEESSVTMSRLAAGDSGLDGWVTLDPLPAVAELQAGRDLVAEPIPLASSDIVIAIVGDRAPALEDTCGGTVGFRCLVDAVGQQWSDLGGEAVWGRFKAGIPPRTSATGLLIAYAAAAGFLGTTDFGSNDLDLEPEFSRWFARYKDAGVANPLTAFIGQFPAAFSAIATTLAEFERGAGSRRDQISTVTPEPRTRAVVVLVGINGGDGGVRDLVAELTLALQESGWSQGGEPGGIPDPGVLLALARR